MTDGTSSALPEIAVDVLVIDAGQAGLGTGLWHAQ